MADLLGYGLALLLGDGLALLLRLEVGELPRHLRALLTRHLLALGPGNLDISVIDTNQRFGSIFIEPGSGQNFYPEDHRIQNQGGCYILTKIYSRNVVNFPTIYTLDQEEKKT